MDAKLLKLLILAAGAYVVASWAMAQHPKGKAALPAPPAPPEPPAPPAYPTDPNFCYLNPDDPRCSDFVGI